MQHSKTRAFVPFGAASQLFTTLHIVAPTMRRRFWSYYTVQNFTRVRPMTSPDDASTARGVGDVEGQDRPLLPDDDGPTRATSLTSAPQLVKRLTVADLVFYGVGSTVGAGIYSLVGPGLKEAGEAVQNSATGQPDCRGVNF